MRLRVWVWWLRHVRNRGLETVVLWVDVASFSEEASA